MSKCNIGTLTEKLYVYPKYYIVHTVRITIDCNVYVSTILPIKMRKPSLKSRILQQNYIYFHYCPISAKVSTRFIWVFIVLWIYNFVLQEKPHKYQVLHTSSYIPMYIKIYVTTMFHVYLAENYYLCHDRQTGLIFNAYKNQ